MSAAARKNARSTAFPNYVSQFTIRSDDYVAQIDAKDFPASGPNGTFRVYRIFGDVTRPDDLHDAICNLLIEHGVDRRRVEVTL